MISSVLDLKSFIVQSIIKRPKMTHQQYTFLCKKYIRHKIWNKFSFLNFYAEVLIFSTLRFLSVCFIRVFQFLQLLESLQTSW